MSNLTLESSIASDICNPGCSPSSSFSTNLQDQPGEANLGQSAQGQPLEAVVGVSEIAQQKKNCGGLVLSCTVIVLLLGFLGAITAPCYIGSGSKARNSAVKGNMRLFKSLLNLTPQIRDFTLKLLQNYPPIFLVVTLKLTEKPESFRTIQWMERLRSP